MEFIILHTQQQELNITNDYNSNFLTNIFTFQTSISMDTSTSNMHTSVCYIAKQSAIGINMIKKMLLGRK
jgi:hypothetical protein